MSKVTKIQVQMDLTDRYRFCGVHGDSDEARVYISLSGKDVSYIELTATRAILEDIAESIIFHFAFKDREKEEVEEELV